MSPASFRRAIVNRLVVAAVVVSHNVRELLLACVASLEAARERGEIDHIVVVDNASRDGSADAVRARFADVRVIDAPNRGYGAGANAGIAQTRGDAVLILNPDTVVPSGTVRRLAEYLEAHPRVAVVGPLLRYPNGQIQSSRRRFPTRWTPFFESTILEEWWPENRWALHYRMADQPRDISYQVDWVVGAAILVRREAIARVGGFDESFRMYSEEVEWQWRFHRHGWKVAWLADAEIVHYEGASSRLDVPARQREFDLGRVRLMTRLYGRRHGSLIRSALLLNAAVMFGRELAKWLLGHRRDLRRERMRVYWRELRHGLRADAHADGCR